MKNVYFILSGRGILIFVWLLMGTLAYADETSDFIQKMHAHQLKIDAQLGIQEQPIDEKAVLDDTFYEATKADRYEQVLIVSDQLDALVR